MSMMKKMVTPNTVFGTNGNDAGGLSALLMPVKASPFGVGVITAGLGFIGAHNALVAAKNKQRLGKVTYIGKPARLTGSVPNSPIASGLMRASGGNPQLAEGMIEEVMTNGTIAGHIQNYGVTPKFVSAFYGM